MLRKMSCIERMEINMCEWQLKENNLLVYEGKNQSALKQNRDAALFNW